MDEQIPKLDEAKLAEIVNLCTLFNIRKATRVITQRYEEGLLPCGLRATQFTLLVGLARAGEAPITMLAEEFAMDRTTLTRNLKPLERDGLLTIEEGSDRRTHLVRLTAKGWQALARVLPVWRSIQESVVSSLGEAQWNTLLEGLRAVIALALPD